MDYRWNISGDYLFYETASALGEAVEALRAMPVGARKLMAECMQHQEVIRRRVPLAAQLLEAAGFVLIRDIDDFFSLSFRISPTLAGEEALLALEEARTVVPLKRKPRVSSASRRKPR